MELKEPDAVPVYPYILTHGVYACGWKLPDITTQTTLDAKKCAQTVLVTLEKYDYDMVIGSYMDLYFGVSYLGGSLKIPDKYGGVVSAAKFPVETPGDWEKVKQKLPIDPRRDERLPSVIESYRIVSEKIGKTHPIVACWWPGPTAAMVLLRGPEQLTYDMAMNPDFALELIKAGNDFAIDFLRAQYEAGANSVTHLGDIYGTEMLSAKDCERYVLPFVGDISKTTMKEQGKKTWLHIHGDFKSDRTYYLIEKFLKEAYVAGFHPDEKHDAIWLKKKVSEKYKIAIAGIIHGPDVLRLGPVDRVVEETKKIIDAIKPGGGAMTAPSCEIPPDVPEEYFRAWVHTAHTYGKY